MQHRPNNCDIRPGVLVPWRNSCGLQLEESISWPGSIWEVSHGPGTQEPAALSGCGFRWIPQGISGSQPGRSCVRLGEEPSGSSIKISLVGNWEPVGMIKLVVIRLFVFWCSNSNNEKVISEAIWSPFLLLIYQIFHLTNPPGKNTWSSRMPRRQKRHQCPPGKRVSVLPGARVYKRNHCTIKYNIKWG